MNLKKIQPTADEQSFRARRFRLLSDEHRLQILELLHGSELNVTEISKQLGIAQSLASHHLKALRLEKILVSKRIGKSITYRISPTIAHGSEQGAFDLGCCKISLSRTPRPEKQG